MSKGGAAAWTQCVQTTNRQGGRNRGKEEREADVRECCTLLYVRALAGPLMVGDAAMRFSDFYHAGWSVLKNYMGHKSRLREWMVVDRLDRIG